MIYVTVKHWRETVLQGELRCDLRGEGRVLYEVKAKVRDHLESHRLTLMDAANVQAWWDDDMGAHFVTWQLKSASPAKVKATKKE